MSQWAKHQPNDGDVIVHCGHLTVPTQHYAWHVEGPPRTFTREDGTTDAAFWFVACRACFEAANGNWNAVAWREDGTWIGDAPSVSTPN